MSKERIVAASVLAACLAPVCISNVLGADAPKPAAAPAAMAANPAEAKSGSGDAMDKSYNPNAVYMSNYTPGKDVNAAIKAALDDPMRPVWERARDAQRKPGEVVAFSGVKAGDHIAELVPGDGYYTRILSPLVGAKGKVYTVVPLPTGMRDGEMMREMEDKAMRAGKPLPVNPVDQALAIMNIRHYNNVTVLWEMLYQYDGQLGVPEQLDAVFSAGGYHDIEAGNYGKIGRAHV